MRIVSGEHCPPQQIQEADDIVLASVASVHRHREVFRKLMSDPRVFIVVDEAHHGPAQTYRELLASLPEERRLLGLTATATRTSPQERPLLGQLFGNRIVFQADVDNLIERRILARPVLIRVDTCVDIDPIIRPSDLKSLAVSGDLSYGTLKRIARMEHRNQAIIEHYLTHAQRYGKTLMFVESVQQAAMLADRMRAAGVKAEYVAVQRIDRGDNQSILKKFRSPGGDIDVLLSVHMLGEGVEVPLARTIF